MNSLDEVALTLHNAGVTLGSKPEAAVMLTGYARKVVNMDYINDFFKFIRNATTAVQAVDTVKERLEQEGFMELKLGELWSLDPSGKYFITPYPSMLVGFTMGSHKYLSKGVRMIAAHTDNPGFRVKPAPEVVSEGMLKLNVERYGGPILNTWFDRPLSLAGRVAVKSEDVLNPRVIHVDFKRPVMTIPNLAIHMNREVNKGVEIKVQKEIQPLMTQLMEDQVGDGYLLELVAKELGVHAGDILDMDLNVYCLEDGQLVGVGEEFISCPRIDDLSMVYAAMEALVESKHEDGVNMIVFMDNEEIGSMTKQGADSMMLSTILDRIRMGAARTEEQFSRQLMDSFVISADGAHAFHPNYAEKNDITNKPVMNQG